MSEFASSSKFKAMFGDEDGDPDSDFTPGSLWNTPPPEDNEPETVEVPPPAHFTLAEYQDNEQEPEIDQDDYMSQVDQRMEVASHYRQLLAAPLFEGGGEAAQIVEEESRRFWMERLEILLSLRSPNVQAQLPFTPVQIKTLTVLADMVLRPGVMEGLLGGPAPTTFPTEVKNPGLPAPKYVEIQPIRPAPLAPRMAPRPAAPVTAPVIRQQPRTQPVQSQPTSSPVKKGRKKKETKTVEAGPALVKVETFVGISGEELTRELPRIMRPKGALPPMSAAESGMAMQQFVASIPNKPPEF